MIRRPPRSTLFPSRRSSDLHIISKISSAGATGYAVEFAGSAIRSRSEEHTSELQSQSNLVCRLLLEQKGMAATRTCSLPRARGVTPPPDQRPGWHSPFPPFFKAPGHPRDLPISPTPRPPL